jgi:hypothetical protein
MGEGQEVTAPSNYALPTVLRVTALANSSKRAPLVPAG